GQGVKNMTVLHRRRLLAASVAAALPLPAIAQGKPEKLVYVGDNGPWHWTLVEEVAPAFEKETGIKIDFTLLPVDPWNARLKAELSAGSSGIDIVQWSVGMAGWISPHMMDHEALAGEIMAKDPAWDWADFLGGSKRAATYDGKMAGIPYRITTGIMHYQKALLEQARTGDGGDRHQHAARTLRVRDFRAAGFGDSDQLRTVALLLRRRLSGLQDRRDPDQ
ncbi:MAG: extracellular solute-binding protein, partial [Rhodopila sp.]